MPARSEAPTTAAEGVAGASTHLTGASFSGRLSDFLAAPTPAPVGLLFTALALAVYVISNPLRRNFYNHFVWQAEAFLSDRFAIRFPVTDGPFTNGYFQDVMPLAGQPGLGLLPFPPLPAAMLTPLVAVFGLATDAALFAAIVGAINVGLAWRMMTHVTDHPGARFLATLFFAFGTVHWYAAMLGSTWFLAHVVGVTFVILAITIALDGERREDLRESVAAVAGRFDPRRWIDPLQFVAGFVFGIAALARLTVIFAAPFFLFVGSGGSFLRRGLSAGIGAAIPLLFLLGYNMAATGHPFNPAYEWLYQHEYLGYLPDWLAIDRSWALQDPRYLPGNTVIMLLWPPLFEPECGLALLNRDCPLLRPDEIGMSLLLTSPAYLLAVPLVVRAWRQRIVMGTVLAVLAIALVNLMHFSQGWVQFGYRFSNDFAPFALILVGLAIARAGVRPLTVLLVAASIVINAWGVYWGVVLGW